MTWRWSAATFAAIAVAGCNAGADTAVISARVSGDQTYQLDLASGDEEGARVVEQAQHFAVSEIRRDASTSWAVRYVYAPAAGFVGVDRVELEVRSGADSPTGPARTRRVSVRLTVQK